MWTEGSWLGEEGRVDYWKGAGGFLIFFGLIKSVSATHLCKQGLDPLWPATPLADINLLKEVVSGL